jgi:predicted PurR-regulated permease PerM
MPRKVEISHRTIVFTVLFLVFVWILYLIREIILQFFLALLITAVLNPTVTQLSRRKIPRAASVIVVYLVLFGAVGITIAAVIPALIEQTTAFINNFPRIVSNIGVSSFVSDQLTQQLVVQLGSLPARVARVTLSVFSNVIGLVAVLVFAFYLLSEREKLDEQLADLIGTKKKDLIENNLALIERKLGNWARGQLALMFVVGLANYVGLTLLGIPFALPLAILAGLLEVVPYVGPIIAAVPAVLIGFGISPVLGFAVAALAFLVQQLENYIFVPKIMQTSTGVHPIITLLSLAIGFKLLGFIGILIAVPVFITLQVLVKSYVLRD